MHLEGLGQLHQAAAGVRDERHPGELVAVERGDVEVEEAHAGLLEERAGGGGEVGVAGADADHQVGQAGEFVGGRGAGVADAADVLGVVVAQGALAGLGGGDRDAGGLGELGEGLLGAAVVDAAAGDQQGPPGRPYRLYGLGEFGGVGARASYHPGALGEELVRPVVGLGLYVLGEREGDRARLHRVGEDAHGLQGGRDQGFRAGDAVEVPRDRAQTVVDRHVSGVRRFQLLEDRVGDPGGEGVAGQQQDGEVVDGREGGAGHEVRRARADGGGHGVGGETVGLPRVTDRRVHHGLLVAALVERHRVGVLDQCLAEPGDVAVAEDAPGRADQPLPYAVTLGVLGGEEAHQRLRDRQPRRRGHR